MSPKEYKILGLFDGKSSLYSDQVTGNPILVPGLEDKESGKTFSIYMQPYEQENEYGIIDPENNDTSLLEIISGRTDEEEPSIAAWWKTDMSLSHFFEGVNQFYDVMKTGETSKKGLLLISGPQHDLTIGCHGTLPINHTRHFEVIAPFNFPDLQSRHSAYYENLRPSETADYGWPFSFDDVTNLIMCTLNFGEIRYDIQSGVAGILSQKNEYSANPEKYVAAVERYCTATQSAFPPHMFRTVFSYAMADDYQQTV